MPRTVIRTDPKKCHCGAAMKPAGYGKFPYECVAADRDPKSMVYIGCVAGHMCWTMDPTDVPSTAAVKA